MKKNYHEEKLKLCMSVRGYLVLGASSPWKIGSIIDHVGGKMGGPLAQPFSVIRETDRQDAQEQTDLIRERLGINGIVGPYKYFYRVSTD